MNTLYQYLRSNLSLNELFTIYSENQIEKYSQVINLINQYYHENINYNFFEVEKIIEKSLLKGLKKEKVTFKYDLLKQSLKKQIQEYAFSKKFLIKKDYIYQNHNSLNLLYDSIIMPDAQTNIFINYFNFFQNLENNHEYHLTSQALTIYILKQLAKLNIIEINNLVYNNYQNLKQERAMFTNHFSDYIHKTYYIDFIKLRNITRSDLNDLFKIALFLNIKMTNLKIIDQEKIYLSLNPEELKKQLLSISTFFRLIKKLPFIIDNSYYFCLDIKKQYTKDYLTHKYSLLKEKCK